MIGYISIQEELEQNVVDKSIHVDIEKGITVEQNKGFVDFLDNLSDIQQAKIKKGKKSYESRSEESYGILHYTGRILPSQEIKK